MQILMIILCIFLPPVAVIIKDNGFTLHFVISLALTILTFGVGGVIHAVWYCFLRK